MIRRAISVTFLQSSGWRLFGCQASIWKSLPSLHAARGTVEELQINCSVAVPKGSFHRATGLISNRHPCFRCGFHEMIFSRERACKAGLRFEVLMGAERPAESTCSCQRWQQDACWTHDSHSQTKCLFDKCRQWNPISTSRNSVLLSCTVHVLEGRYTVPPTHFVQLFQFSGMSPLNCVLMQTLYVIS